MHTIALILKGSGHRPDCGVYAACHRCAHGMPAQATEPQACTHPFVLHDGAQSVPTAIARGDRNLCGPDALLHHYANPIAAPRQTALRFA